MVSSLPLGTTDPAGVGRASAGSLSDLTDMNRPKLAPNVGFALKFLETGVIILPLDLRNEKPDEVVMEAVDATLTLEKIRTTRKLLIGFTLLIFFIALGLAQLKVDPKYILATALAMNGVLLAIQYLFEWAQRVQCEEATKRLREERILQDN